MRVAITGATGLVGAALAQALRARGDEAVSVSRRPGPNTIVWDPGGAAPEAGFGAPDALAGFDAVVNLAGESIAGRWTAAKKARILASRVDATRTVIAALAQADPQRRPSILINASAVGIYGERGDEQLDEASPPGRPDEFLVGVTQAWEREANQVEALPGPPVRLCLARFGVILDREGGALATMLTPFRLGVGGKIGSGRQWMPWVHIADTIAALLFLLDHDSCRGAYNLVAPEPVRNAEFTTTLGRVLHRPTFLPLPRIGVRVALGEMGEALLLDGQRAVPGRLREAGFEFRHPKLEPALRELLDDQ